VVRVRLEEALASVAGEDGVAEGEDGVGREEGVKSAGVFETVNDLGRRRG
jgi:hypothetical protein